MKNKLITGLIIFFSAYIGLLLGSLYLYFKYQKFFEDKQTIIREEHIEKIKKIKFNTGLKSIYLNFHYTYEINNLTPFGNISNSTILYGKEEYWSIFETDKYGFFHNDNDSYIDPDLILLGDSFGKGCCVKTKEAPNTLFEKEGYKILNLSSGGGTLVEVATYLEYAKNYKNKKIILLFYEGNDYEDNNEEFKNKNLLKYFDNLNYSQNLINKQKIIDYEILNKLNKLQKKDNKKIDLNNLFTLRYLNLAINQKYFKSENNLSYNNLKILLVNFNNYLLNNGNELILVHIPLSTRYNQNNNHTLDQKKNLLLNILKENKIKSLDFAEYVSENELYKRIYRFDSEIQNNSAIFPIKKRHFNREGYSLLIKYISENIKNQN